MRLRGVLAIAVLAAACGAAPARAGFISAPDVVFYCDPDIAHACAAVGAEFRGRTGIPVRVLSAPSPQLLALLAHGTRNDVLLTLTAQVDAAAAQRLLAADSRAGPWDDPLVLGGRGVEPLAATPNAGQLAKLQGAGRLALVDPTETGSLDGAAVAQRLGWHPTAVAGALDGTEVAWMLAHFSARLGVLPRSALLAEPSLTVVAPIPADAYPPVSYAAAVSQGALSRNATAFLDFLKTPAAQAVLANAGLERMP